MPACILASEEEKSPSDGTPASSCFSKCFPLLHFTPNPSQLNIHHIFIIEKPQLCICQSLAFLNQFAGTCCWAGHISADWRAYHCSCRHDACGVLPQRHTTPSKSRAQTRQRVRAMSAFLHWRKSKRSGSLCMQFPHGLRHSGMRIVGEAKTRSPEPCKTEQGYAMDRRDTTYSSKLFYQCNRHFSSSFTW